MRLQVWQRPLCRATGTLSVHSELVFSGPPTARHVRVFSQRRAT